MNPKYRHVLLELMVEQMHLTVPTSLGASLLVSLVIAPTFGVVAVSIWFLAGVLIGVGRVLLFRYIVPSHLASKKYRRVTNAIGLTLFITGLHWGAAAWFFLDPQNADIYLFVAVVILGMVLAGLANLSALPYLWLMYAMTVFSFVIARMISLNNWPVAVMSCLFILGMWGLSKKLGKQILLSITKDFKNAELLKEVEIAKAKVESASLAKSRFMAATSHDLRQPLHAQGLFLSAFKNQLTTDTQLNLLNKVFESNKALNSMFDALLEVSQLDANTIKVNRCHLPIVMLCKGLLSEFELLAEDKGLTLVFDGNDCVVFSDPILLRRVIRNLISNAIKYTQEGSVTLRVETCGEFVNVSIIDTGIGIAESEQEAIFDEYVQLNNKKRDRTQGVGLGLALVKKMCQLLNHKLTLTSRLGDGASFMLSMPKGDDGQIVSATVDKNTLSVKGLTIFVIDDDEPILESMCWLEEDWQCHFELFSSLEQVLLFVESNDVRPDVIISDFRFDENITGIDVIARLRTFYKADVPALLISGDTDADLLVEVKEVGLPMLHKPLDASKLKTSVALIVNKSSQA